MRQSRGMHLLLCGLLFSCGGSQGASELVVSATPKVLNASDSYSFVVFGDTRMPGYLNFTEDQRIQLDEFVKQNYQHDDYTPTFDDQGQLIELVYPASAPQKRLVLDQGWPAKVWRFEGDASRLILRAEGQAWVYDSIIEQFQDTKRNVQFALHSGDLAYNGYYGTDPEKSPYWGDFKTRFLDRLPKGAPENLPGRFFVALGNHETWMDDENQGILNTVPYLPQVGLTSDNHMYSFDHRNARFVFLDTGGYPPVAEWSPGSKPSFDEQMSRLKTLLTEARQNGIDHVFISLHKPPFCAVGHGHLGPEQNPHDILVPFAADLNIYVFSGHVHSTEMYRRNSIAYFVLGAGGADQTFSENECPETDFYCQGESYWQGADRVEEYNFMTVAVEAESTTIELTRWRPEAAQNPYESCRIAPLNDTVEVDCVPSTQ